MRLDTALKKFVSYLEDSDYPLATVKGYVTDIKQFISFLEEFKVDDVSAISTKHSEMFIDELVMDSYAPRSISRKINAIKLFDEFLFNQGLIQESFSNTLKHPQHKDKPLRILTKDELERLRDVIKEDKKYRAIIETLLQTGMKIGELSKLTLRDVVLVAGPKFGKVHIRDRRGERVVPINNAMEKVIEEYLAVRPESESDALFVTKNGKPLLERNIRRKIKDYFKKAGIANATVNDLRNTFIANQLTKGVSIGRVAYLVGYRSISSLNKFVELLGDKVKPPDYEVIEEV